MTQHLWAFKRDGMVFIPQHTRADIMKREPMAFGLYVALSLMRGFPTRQAALKMWPGMEEEEWDRALILFRDLNLIRGEEDD